MCRTVRRAGDGIEAHIVEFSNTVSKLAALSQELKDVLIASMLLCSLPESYHTLVTVLESSPKADIMSQFMKDMFIKDEYRRPKGAQNIQKRIQIASK